MKPYAIGELSNKTGVNIETIRYYEREAILPEAVRASNGRRVYDEEDVKRLHFIHKCRSLGFTLKEIISLMNLVDTGNYSCKQVHELTLVHVKEVREKMEDLMRMERVLVEMTDQCSQGNVAQCPIIDRLFDDELV